MDQTHLVTASSHVGGDHGVEADREHVVLVCGEGELALLLHILPVHEVMTGRVCHHHVHLK